MKRSLFDRIYEALSARNEYFRQKVDGLGRPGFHGKHKCVVAMRMLAYGHIADALDDGYAMAESTVLECVKEFARTVIEVFEGEYLRPPNEEELARIRAENDARGFPGMIGSIDCMHWEWGACPVGWHGQFIGHKGRPTVILEAVATKDLRIWHAFFGMAGSNNDLNVLDRSPVFDDLANGRTHPVEFMVNGHSYDMGYYLADKIYPDWATLVKTNSHPVNAKDSTFATAQESVRKDVERAFGVLRSKFRIIQQCGRLWSPHDMNTIMRACIILHNMCIEAERDQGIDEHEFDDPSDPPIPTERNVAPINEFMAAYRKLQDKPTSLQLQQDLIEHHWMLKGNEEGPYARRRRQ